MVIEPHLTIQWTWGKNSDFVSVSSCLCFCPRHLSRWAVSFESQHRINLVRKIRNSLKILRWNYAGISKAMCGLRKSLAFSCFQRKTNCSFAKLKFFNGVRFGNAKLRELRGSWFGNFSASVEKFRCKQKRNTKVAKLSAVRLCKLPRTNYWPRANRSA